MKLTQMSFAFVALLACFAFTAPRAHAGLYLEPYASYATGSWSESSTNQNMNGLTYGARVAYSFPLGFQLGADVSSGNWTDNSTPSYNVQPTDLGIYAGYDFPILVHVWLTYDVSSQLKYTQNSSSDTFKGSAFKLGIGFKVLPLLSINFDYEMGTYNKDNNNNTNAYGNLTDKMFMVGLSIPLNLLN